MAIGNRDFERAYSYFGPTFRSNNDKENWISDEESYEIRSATVTRLDVTEVSDNMATANVVVSFRDNTGSPRFKITWKLAKEDGGWKLDEQTSGQRTG